MDFTSLNELIASGAEADVYRFGNHAIKLFKQHCSKSEAFYEAAVHTAVEATKLPIPKIHQVLKIENRWAIVMDLVSGTTMKDIIINDLKDINLHIDSIVNLQFKMHQIEANGLIKLDERLATKILSTDKLSVDQKQHLNYNLKSFESDNKLCHGDFHFLNLIKTSHEIMIIDWIDAACGNPEADVCRTYLLYLIYAKHIAELYLNAYCKKSNKEAKDIKKWLPIIAGARLSENKENEFKILTRLIM